jgi:hypothetical protein
MTEQESVEIAKSFAVTNKVPIGVLLRAVYISDEKITQIRESVGTADPKIVDPRTRWAVTFELVSGVEATLTIIVDEESRQASVKTGGFTILR